MQAKPVTEGLAQWRLNVDADRVAWLTFDRPGAGTNTLSRAAMEELDQRLGELESLNPAGLVVVCGSMFLVGYLRGRLLGEPLDPTITSDPV